MELPDTESMFEFSGGDPIDVLIDRMDMSLVNVQ